MSSSLDTLVDTCKRYKTGTTKFLTWLYDASFEARKSLPQETLYVTTKALRSNVKRIPVKQLEQLATAIVKASPSVAIPLEMLDIAKDVINGRKWCCDWFSSLRPDDKDARQHAESNATHRYFLGAFEDTFAILKQEAKKRQPKRKKIIKLATDDDDLSNVFMHLGLEEVSEDFSAPSADLPLSEISGNARTPSSPTEILYVLEDDESFTTLFEIWGLLNDLHGIRMQAATAHKSLLLGELSMVAACQINDHAIQLSIIVATEFHSVHPNLSSFLDIIKYVGIEIFTGHDSAAQDKRLGDSGLTHTPELLCIPAWTALQHVNRRAEELKSKAQHKKPQGSNVDAVPSNHPFAEALLSIVPDFVGFLEAGGHTGRITPPSFLSFADEYTQQLVHFLACPHWNAGFVAATQLYMDFFDSLGGDLSRGVRDCEPILDPIDTTAKEYIAWCKQLDKPASINTSSDAPGTLEQLRCIAMAHWKDPTRGEGWMLRQDLSASGLQAEPFFMPLKVLATLPMLAGHLTRKVRLIAHRNEIALCNGRGVVLAAAHLHNATKLLKLPSNDWPGLDFVVDRQDSSYLRQGNGSVLSAARQYSIALGASLKDVTRSNNPTILSIGHIGKNSVLLESASYFNTNDTATLVLRDGSLQMNAMYDAVRGYAKQCGIKDKVVADQWLETKRLTPGQILLVLHEIVLEDEKHILFNYIGLLQEAVDILAGIGEACSLKPRSNSTALQMSRNTLIYEQVYDILWNAVKIETRGLPVVRSPLFLARAKILAALEKKGAEEPKKL